MTVYRCTACRCLHGWSTHPAVWPVTRHQRGPFEDIWWCPCCRHEHRTTDGTPAGQLYKRWEVVTDADVEAELRWERVLR